MTSQETTVILKVSPRSDAKPHHLRQQALVPLVLYGKGVKPQLLQANEKRINHILRECGTTTLIDLVIGEEKPRKVLFKEPQFHPATHRLLHSDLYQVDLTKTITADVPLIFEGVSPAVDDLGGSLIESKSEVEVECLPQDLPHELTIDISSLKTFEDTLHVKDIKLPPGVTILDEADEVIASVAEPRSEEELAALDEAIEEDVEGVEVEEKGEEEGEESAEEEGEAPTEGENKE